MRRLVASSLVLWLAAVLPEAAEALCDVSVVGWIGLSGRVRGVEVVGPLAYVANGSEGLSIINVAQPFAPRLVGARRPGGAPV